MAFDGIGKIVPDVPSHVDSMMGQRKLSNFSLVSTAHLEEWEVFPQENVEVVTDLKQFGWTQEVAGSKVMIGVGWPKLSPSRKSRSASGLGSWELADRQLGMRFA